MKYAFRSRASGLRALRPIRLAPRWCEPVIIGVPTLMGLAASIWLVLRAPDVGTYSTGLYQLMPVLGVGVGFALNAWRERRIRRRVVRAGGQLCTSCGHSLCGLPEVGRCPECGREYRLDATMMAWAMGGYLPPVTPGKSSTP